MLGLILIQLALYAAIYLLSDSFEYGSSESDRPIRVVFSIWMVLSGLSLLSLHPACRLSSSRYWVGVMFVVAIAMRCFGLASHPIQELDLYRYLWDGAVASQGISPYEFAPKTIVDQLDSPPPPFVEGNDGMGGKQDTDVTTTVAGAQIGSIEGVDPRPLVQLAADRPGLQQVLRRVHYPELPSVYPPVSQLVFRAVQPLIPAQAGVDTYVTVMKMAIVCFDLGTMFLLYLMLRTLRLNPAWCIAYGWSPLVMQEFSWNGHLDAITVFLVMAAMTCLAKSTNRRARRQRSAWVSAAAVFLGLGVGAKLFPIVFFPVVLTFVAKRHGWRHGLAWLALGLLVAVLSLWPMRSRSTSMESNSLKGLQAFLAYWEMNDFIFMLVHENLRPDPVAADAPSIWFAVTPDGWRSAVVDSIASRSNIAPERLPFMVTRAITTLTLGAIVLSLMVRTWQRPRFVFAAAFLSIAWFWLLAPTQNPWYWIWALPLVPFVRNRAWLLMGCVVLAYYLRFWCRYHPDRATIGPYQGVATFDFVLVWFEYVPLLALLAWLSFRNRNGRPSITREQLNVAASHDNKKSRLVSRLLESISR